MFIFDLFKYTLFWFWLFSAVYFCLLLFILSRFTHGADVDRILSIPWI